MRGRVYRAGISCLGRLGRLAPLTRAIDYFSKVWQRHCKLRVHLRAQGFDGVIDGGANVGEFADIVRNTLPHADLLCVEPHPECAQVLRQKGFRVVEAALWRESARLRLNQPTAASTSSTVKSHNNSNGSRGWDVDALRLDSLQISGQRLLVKLDLQGCEAEALEGMGTLWKRCAGVLLEVSIGNGGSYESLRDLLTHHGFYEYSTINELDVDGRVIEADKLWLRH
jgi:methyltransferase, FkbM family